MKAHLKIIGEKKFMLFAVLGCILGDLWLAYYLYQKFADRTIFQKMLDVVMAQPQNQGLILDQQTTDGIYAIMLNTLLFFLAVMIFIHLINYFFFSKKKSFAFRYLTLLTWIGSPGCILLGLGQISMPMVGITFIIQGLIYGYVAMGLWHYPWSRD